MSAAAMTPTMGPDNRSRAWTLLLCGVGLSTLIYWISTRKSNKKRKVLLVSYEDAEAQGTTGTVNLTCQPYALPGQLRPKMLFSSGLPQ